MKTIELKLYKFEELSEEAQQQVIENYLNRERCYHWESENRATLEAFCNVIGLDSRRIDYEYGDGYGHVSVNTGAIDDDVLNLSGPRLLSYVWNNWRELFERKYLKHGELSPEKKEYHRMRAQKLIKGGPNAGKYSISYYSNIQLELDNCPLTGYYMDSYILYPVVQLWKDYSPEKTLQDLIEECFESWLEGCKEDYSNFCSEEYAREELINNIECEYLEDGREFAA